MNLSEQLLPWEALQPTLSINQITTQSVDFFDLQPQAQNAIDQFLNNPHCSLLMLKADEQPEYASAVENFVKLQQGN